MRIKWKLTIACLRMFFRQRESVFWTIFLPIFMIILFGFVKFDRLGTIQVGVVNAAGNRADSLFKALTNIQTIKLYQGSEQEERQALTKGERDVVLMIPQSFGSQSGQPMLYVNNAKPQETQLGTLVIQRVLDELTIQQDPSLHRVELQVQSVKGRKLTYMDFLIPGILGMSIMQMGIFSVAFVFVELKRRGTLRRLMVTPINPHDFIFAQVVTRLVVLLIQNGVIVGAGVLFFHLNFSGNFWNLLALGVIGAIVFLGIGFAIAGVSKSADQVAPLANLVSMPMMLLSGVFFSRATLPGIIHRLTDFFPLTFLVDGLRSVAIDGAHLREVGVQLGGLLAWSVVTCALAIKMFRWE